MAYTHPQPIYLQDYKVPEYLIDQVELEFNLDEAFATVKSHLVMRVNPASSCVSSDLILQGESLELEAVSLNGQLLKSTDYHVTNKSLTIYTVPKQFELEIQTRIKPQENTTLNGLYKSSGNFCTQCEAEGFRRITYFLDRPDVMARYATTIIANEMRYPVLLSNGNLVASGKLVDGKHWVRWEDPFKKPSYLFALVAGDLELVKDYFDTQSGRRVALQIFVEKGQGDQCGHAMNAVKKAMRWDEECFGREYDLDIYMIVAVSDFNMGAMENKGLNIFNSKYILAKPDTATDDDFIHVESVIAHEYFHNWTGDRITCRDWFQLSLKEGLTIFRDQSFTEDTTSKTVARIREVNVLRTQQFSEDAGPLAHPVRPDSYIEINNFYTSTVYNKGSEVIRMMQTILGKELFRQGMDLYFDRHDGQAVTIEDFIKAMEDASKIDLTQFRLWYTQAGTPLLEVKSDYDIAKKIYHLMIKQSCLATPGQPQKKPFHIPVKMGLIDERGKEIVIENNLLHVKDAENHFQFDNIVSKPVPSLLRGFSAPVKIKFHYSDAELQLLCKHDHDEFNRWEAGQRYAVNVLLRLVEDFQHKKELLVPVDFVETFQHILTMQQEDKWLLSEILLLPSEKYLAEQMTEIDVDAIHAAREAVLKAVASRCKNEFLQFYQQHQFLTCKDKFSVQDASQRYFKNLCLSYLMVLPDASHIELCIKQFNLALSSNMTEVMAALRGLVNVECSQRGYALAEFYKTWQRNALVIDKWLSLQATSKLPGTLANVKKLLHHEAFDIKNPNKVYALIGAFVQHNPIHFHAADGEGYAFLSELVQRLDVLNPQIAARMVSPLTSWRRYDKNRQQLMQNQLQIIAQNQAISRDVYELVSKSLK